MAIYTYHINKDERGEFHADVRKDGCDGNTVFFINGTELFGDGFMAHKNDTKGLQEHLYGLGVFGESDRIGTQAEVEAEARSTVLRADSQGNMLLPNGDLIFHRYPAGDYDNISATNPDLDHLHRALFDARECGEVPYASVFTLPNGEEFNIDTYEPVSKPGYFE